MRVLLLLSLFIAILCAFSSVTNAKSFLNDISLEEVDQSGQSTTNVPVDKSAVDSKVLSKSMESAKESVLGHVSAPTHEDKDFINTDAHTHTLMVPGDEDASAISIEDEEYALGQLSDQYTKTLARFSEEEDEDAEESEDNDELGIETSGEAATLDSLLNAFSDENVARTQQKHKLYPGQTEADVLEEMNDADVKSMVKELKKLIKKRRRGRTLNDKERKRISELIEDLQGVSEDQVKDVDTSLDSYPDKSDSSEGFSKSDIVTKNSQADTKDYEYDPDDYDHDVNDYAEEIKEAADEGSVLDQLLDDL